MPEDVRNLLMKYELAQLRREQECRARKLYQETEEAYPARPVVIDERVMVDRMQKLLDKLARLESAPLLWEGDQA